MTLQSLAVICVGGLLGPRWGVASCALYVGAAAAGLPVLSDGGGGWDKVTGATAGYIVGFVAAAAWVGWRAQTQMRWPGWLLAGLQAHVLMLALGWAWLATVLGPDGAWRVGVAPFALGALVKSAAAATVLWLSKRHAAV